MTKAEYFNDVEKTLLNDRLFITNQTDLLVKEISENLRAIGITKELAGQVNVSELLGLLDKINADRQIQLNNADMNVNLRYYLWHDEQAGQLRMNFINASHEVLLFNCTLLMVRTEEEIVRDFLRSPYLDGIQMSEFMDEPISELDRDERFILKVYSSVLKKDDRD